MAVFKKNKSKKKRRKNFVPPIDVERIDTSSFDPTPFHNDISYGLNKADEASENLAPVFVKIAKYRDILNTVNYLKMGFNLIKNQIAIMSRLENLQRENMKLLYSVLDKVSSQLSKLDSDFTRPVDFMKEVSEMKLEDVEGLESTIRDLKSQIDNLKIEVDSMI